LGSGAVAMEKAAALGGKPVEKRRALGMTANGGGNGQWAKGAPRNREEWIGRGCGKEKGTQRSTKGEERDERVVARRVWGAEVGVTIRDSKS